MRLVAIVGIVSLAISGCGQDPADYETPAVHVKTSAGEVTCQLYVPIIPLWDRSISRPPSMEHGDADAICREQGPVWGRRN